MSALQSDVMVAVAQPRAAATMSGLDKRDLIHSKLIEMAKLGRTIYYSELGAAVGMPPQGPWKPVLDLISRSETGAGKPDLTYLVINKTTGLPGQIGFKPAKPPTAEQRQMADQAIQKVFAYYRNRNG